MKVTFGSETHKCARAVKTDTSAVLYLESGSTIRFFGVSDFSAFSFDGGGWEEPSLPEIQSSRQEENKVALATWLAGHPLTWTDGNVYGVTEEDQNEMSLNLQQYQVQVSVGREAVLEWHTQKKQCHTFTPEHYTALLLAIIDYVYPYRRYQESVKAAIFNARTIEEVNAIQIDYSSVSIT